MLHFRSGLTTIGTLNQATIANVQIDPTDGLITSLNANALKLDSATAVIEVQNKRISCELQIPTPRKMWQQKSMQMEAR